MPAGVSDGTIEDTAITASSFMDTSSKPSAGRLNSSNGAWCANVSDKHQYLQIDLGKSVARFLIFCFAQSVKIGVVYTESYEKRHLRVITFLNEKFSNDEGIVKGCFNSSVHACRTTEVLILSLMCCSLEWAK